MVWASEPTTASKDRQMFATPAISDPWRLDIQAHRPSIEGPRVTRADVVLIGAVATLLIAVVAPTLAIAAVIVIVVAATLWSGIQAIGPVTKPLVDGDPFTIQLPYGAHGFAR
jgi:hypothetical protein